MATAPLPPHPTKDEIVRNWLPRYTGMPLDHFGRWILLTNFQHYVERFAELNDVPVQGVGGPMPTATSSDGITIVNYGMGSANAATVMDLLTAVDPHAVLFLGKCGGLRKSTAVGQFILPIGAIRGEGTANAYMPPEVPALPSFAIHQFAAGVITELELEYRTGVIYTTNRRVWEWDDEFRAWLRRVRVTAIDMETATIFVVGHANRIPRGAVLLVSDVPMLPDGIKTEESDRAITRSYADLHLDIGLRTVRAMHAAGGGVKHFQYE